MLAASLTETLANNNYANRVMAVCVCVKVRKHLRAPLPGIVQMRLQQHLAGCHGVWRLWWLLCAIPLLLNHALPCRECLALPYICAACPLAAAGSCLDPRESQSAARGGHWAFQNKQ